MAIIRAGEWLAEEDKYKMDYPSWQEAARYCLRQRPAAELEQLKEAALKVKSGKAVHQRNGVVFDKVEYSWPFLSGLLLAASLNDNSLNVIDFGGALGNSYYQNRKFFDRHRRVPIIL